MTEHVSDEEIALALKQLAAEGRRNDPRMSSGRIIYGGAPTRISSRRTPARSSREAMPSRRGASASREAARRPQGRSARTR